VVLWSHGSGWTQENGRDGAEIVAAKLTPLGIAVAGVAIRSSANAQFPGQLHDIKAAIRFLKSNAGRYGLDSDRFAVMGESSGGWTAAVANVTGNVPELEGEIGVTGTSSSVAAAVPFYPPTDFLQMDAHMIDCGYFDGIFHLADCHNDPKSPESLLVGCQITTCPDKVAQAIPITYVDRDDPPMLILHGTNDRLVPHHQSELLLGAVQKACGDATFVSISGGEHGAWAQWLDGRVSPGGTSATATKGCQSSTQPSAANWDTVIAFLRRTIAA
jgi:acetyl esterase/lipase